MKSIAFLPIALSMSAAAADVRPTLTFDEAVARAGERISQPSPPPLESEIAALRRSLLPSVRADVTANSSRTLDFFAGEPFVIHSVNSVLAFDYSLWDGGLTRARVNMVESNLRRLGEKKRLDDGRFLQLVEVFGQLYLAQRQIELMRPLHERLSQEAEASTVLISSGEITNLVAADMRETALAFGSQLLELEARRIDSAAKIQLMTGLDQEPTVSLNLSQPPPDVAGVAVFYDDQTEAARYAVEDSRLRLREVMATKRFGATLSGFLGLGAAESTFSGLNTHAQSSVYGLRVLFSYPLFGGRSEISIAETRAALQQALAWQTTAAEATRARAAEYRLRAEIAEKRIALLSQSVQAARDREESLQRLVRGGVRSQGELVRAEAERTRREGEVIAAEIDRWKALRLLARMITPAEDLHR